MSFLRYLVRENPVLYRVWFRIKRSRCGDPVRLPGREDVIYVDGFPRSGNTYVTNLIRFVFNDVQFASHLHCVAPVKMALSMGLRVYVVVRAPLEATGSLLFTKVKGDFSKVSDELIRSTLGEFVRFGSFVLANRARLRLIVFPEVLEYLPVLLGELSEVFGKQHKSATFSRSIADFHAMMEGVESGKQVESGSLPNERRARFKHEVESKIRQLPAFAQAVDIYERLKRSEECLRPDFSTD